MPDELAETIEEAEDELEEGDIDEEEDDESETDADYEEMTHSFSYRLMNPINLSMFILACCVDGAELVLDVIGIIAVETGVVPVVVGVIALILDIGALFIIGFWLLSKTGTAVLSKRALKLGSQTAKKGAAMATEESEKMAQLIANWTKWAGRLKWIRFLAPIFEMLPYVSIVPMWAVAVYLEIKYGGE